MGVAGGIQAGDRVKLSNVRTGYLLRVRDFGRWLDVTDVDYDEYTETQLLQGRRNRRAISDDGLPEVVTVRTKDFNDL